MKKILSHLEIFQTNKSWRLIGLLGVFQLLLLLAYPVNNQPVMGQIEEYEVTEVVRGDINLAASGSGTLAVAKRYDLAFSTSGSLDFLFVQLGDQVTAGEVLAVSSEINTLQRKVVQAEKSLNESQNELDTYLSTADDRISQALLDRATAQKQFEEAEKNSREFGVARCTDKLTNSYFQTYMDYVPEADQWEEELNDPDTHYGIDFILEQLTPLKEKRDEAYMNYQYCQGYTSEEVVSSQAALQLATTNLEKAQSDYDFFVSTLGIDQSELDLLAARVKNLEYQLLKAKEDLEGATLNAPVDGTILAINAREGDSVGTSVIISMADLSQLIVNVSVDELDFKALQVGCDAQVVFTAIKERTFSGEVTQVSPKTTSGNNSQTIKGVISLQDAYLLPGRYLAPNMNGTVSLSCGQASRVLLVPATSVYQINGQYFVYVLNENNEPEKTLIEIGLQSGSYKEVVSGLQEGEIIITSQISD